MAENNETQTQGILPDSLALALSAKFEECKSRRLMYEEEWLKDLRQYLGQYDPEVEKKMDPNRSKAFIRLTRTKVKSLDARLKDMMFPAGGDKNWGIRPTAVPTEVRKAVEAVAGKVMQLQSVPQQPAVSPMADVPTIAPLPDVSQQNAPQGQAQGVPDASGAQPAAGTAPAATALLTAVQAVGAQLDLQDQRDRLEDEIIEAASKDARERCLRMEAEINEQLQDAHYADLCGEVIHDGSLYGTGVLKGPLVEIHKSGSWSLKDNVATYTEMDESRPYMEHVPIWDIFPDMSAMSMDDCEYLFQRHVMLKAELAQLATRPDFNGPAILEHIRQYPDGDSTIAWYTERLREINRHTTDLSRRRRYELHEYWGPVSFEDLVGCGCEVPPELEGQEIEANIWTLGQKVIKAVLNPFDAKIRPYYFFYFDKDDTGVFGVGIPRVLRDTQAVFNAMVRAAIDNSAVSAGPMFEVTKELLAPGEDTETIAPFRTWLRKAGEGNQSAIRPVETPNNAAQLLNLAMVFKQLGDEASTIPSYTHGENDQGVAKTVGGMSMLMGAAGIALKDTVRNFDQGITEPAIRAMYHWNMQFNPDQTIKGDYHVEARGVTSLVAKEVRAGELERFAAGSANPLDSPFVNRRELLRQRALALDLSPEEFLYSQEEIAKRTSDEQANMPPNPVMLNYQVEMANLQLKEFIAKGKQQIAEATIGIKQRDEAMKEILANIKQREEALKEHTEAMIAAHSQLAKIVEQIRTTV